MTTIEKILWMQDNCCTVTIDFNDHRSCYETVEEYLNFMGRTREGCETWKALVTVHVYPTTPIGSYFCAAQTLDEAVDSAYENVKKDLG